MSSSPFRSYFPRNGARYHPLSRPFPFSFNPAPDLTPPPDISPSLFPSLSLVLFHFPLHIFIRSSLLTINAHHLHVGSLDQPPLLPPDTRSNPSWSLSSVSLLPTLDTLGGPVSPGALASSTPPRLNSSAISRPRGIRDCLDLYARTDVGGGPPRLSFRRESGGRDEGGTACSSDPSIDRFSWQTVNIVDELVRSSTIGT